MLMYIETNHPDYQKLTYKNNKTTI